MEASYKIRKRATRKYYLLVGGEGGIFVSFRGGSHLFPDQPLDNIVPKNNLQTFTVIFILQTNSNSINAEKDYSTSVS